MLNPETLQESVHDAFEFLKTYDWIHSVQVTHVLNGTLHCIPTEWLPFLRQLSTEELGNLPFLGETSTHLYPAWPASLHTLLNLASRLSMNREQSDLKPTVLDHNMVKGMNPKKKHEVSYMASLIHEVVAETGCDLIIDVGSGLGYLDHTLHKVYGHAILGLETSESHVSGAESRAVKQGLQGSAIKNVKFHLVNDAACFEQFETLIATTGSSLIYQNKMPLEARGKGCTDAEASSGCEEEADTHSSASPRVCLIGLHCCGDLTPTMLALFHHVPSVKAICCVSCCYHKMKLVSEQYPSFPLSAYGTEKYSQFMHGDSLWHILPQTLRLGAQETRSQWKMQSEEDRSHHTNHVAFRGLLELAGCGDAAIRRKIVRKCDFSSFESFLMTYFSSSCWSNDEISSGKAILKDLYIKYKTDFCLIEIFTVLQVIVQPVVESLIHHDRLLWLMEQGHSNIKMIPIFDEGVSPRNLATVVFK